jgi:hypothetical protein
MSDTPSNGSGPFALPNRAMLAGAAAAVVVVAVAAVLLIWGQGESETGATAGSMAEDPSTPAADHSPPESATSSATPEPGCVEDATQVFDEEAGLCYSVPEGWYVYDEALLQTTNSTSAISSDDDLAWFATGPVASYFQRSTVEETARYLVAEEEQISTESFSIQSETGEIDGYPMATATDSYMGTWMLVTVIQLEDGMVTAVGTSSNSEDDLMAQVEDLHATLTVA